MIHILLIDDQKSNLDAIENMLKEQPNEFEVKKFLYDQTEDIQTNINKVATLENENLPFDVDLLFVDTILFGPDENDVDSIEELVSVNLVHGLKERFASNIVICFYTTIATDFDDDAFDAEFEGNCYVILFDKRFIWTTNYCLPSDERSKQARIKYREMLKRFVEEKNNEQSSST